MAALVSVEVIVDNVWFLSRLLLMMFFGIPRELNASLSISLKRKVALLWHFM
jgi:hypothetical protein